MTKLKVYVDGSYNPSTRFWGAGSLILTNDNVKLEEILDSQYDTCGSRQISGECFSVINALKKIYDEYDLSEIKEIQIYYDFTGIEKWAKSKWAARSAIAIEYSKLVKQLITVLRFEKNVNVTFHKVKAHSSDHFNNAADRLAKKACNV